MSDSDWTIDDEHWNDGEDDDVENAAAIPCPECGAELFDDADHCHRCGHWLSEADRRAMWSGTQRPAWIKWVAVVMLTAFVGGLLVSVWATMF